MPAVFRPTLEEIEKAFGEAVAPYGGLPWDRCFDGQRLCVRAVYPQIREIVAGDQLQRGVALRVADEAIGIYPYLFRQTSHDGAILTWAVARQAKRLRSRGTSGQVAAVLDELRRLVVACSDEMILQNAVQHIRLAAEVEANVVGWLMPLLATLPQPQVGDVLDRITVRFEAQRNRSLFELINAVSAVARETPDPTTRWRLEELAGSLIARNLAVRSRPRVRAPSGRRLAAARR
jgi:hypothetical protein